MAEAEKRGPGRPPNLIDNDETFNLSLPSGAVEYLKEALATHIYGQSVPDAARHLVLDGIRRLISERMIGPNKAARHYELKKPDTDQSEPEAGSS